MEQKHPSDKDQMLQCKKPLALAPRISVLLCVFNGGIHLKKAVQSILNQSIKDLELVVVNDGSTDDAVEEIRQLADVRIRILDKSNSGLTKSLNFGLRHCRGVYIARQDADDYSYPDRLRQQLFFLETHPDIDVVGSAVEIIDEDDHIIGSLAFDLEHDLLQNSHFQSNQFAHGSLFFRQSILESLGGYRDAFVYAQDYDLTLRCQEVTCVANLPDCLYQVRYGQDRLSFRQTDQQKAFAEMARCFAKGRRTGRKDSLERQEYDGNFMQYAAGTTESTNSLQVLVHLYLRAGYPEKVRSCLQQLFRQPTSLSRRLKYGLNFLFSYFPVRFTRQVYQVIDRLRGVDISGR